MFALKNGLYHENGELIYYKNDKPYHAGVIQIEKDIYYISSHGKAVKGEHVIHGEMTNGILKRGTYTFDEAYKLIPNSYIAPRKKTKKVKQNKTAQKKSPRRKQSLKERIKQIKHVERIGAMLVVAVVLLAVVWVAEASVHGESEGRNPSVATPGNVQVKLPEFTEDVLLCSTLAKQEYDGEVALKTAVEAGDPYRPFYFTYSLTKCNGILYVGEEADLSDARKYTLLESEQKIAIDNLKVDTTYYYKVVAAKQNYYGSFHTAPATRFVYIPGLENTRDIGGGMTRDGKQVKQGLLIRGVEVDGLVNASYFIPVDELENVKENFGFVYDMDLRSSDIYKWSYRSRLGIDHAFYAAPMYGEIFKQSYHNSLKRIFSDLADPEKYPMYLHCTWGKDRTGTIVFLLQGVLNMSEEDMKREYALTSYVSRGLLESNNMDVIISGLEPFAGDTLQEKIVTFLTKEIGVTEAEIASIRSIFLEE